MRKFKGKKPIDQIVADAKEFGHHIDTSKYDAGGDWITISGTFAGKELEFIYSSFNGRVIGKTPAGEMFASEDATLDGEDWFDEILDFVYGPSTKSQETR